MTKQERVDEMLRYIARTPDMPEMRLRAYLIVEVQDLRYTLERLVELLEARL